MRKLRTIMFLGIGLLLNPFLGSAQIGVGLRTGFTLSTFTGEKSWSSANVIPNLGAAVGVVGEFRVLNKDRTALYVQTELLLLQKGFAFRSDDRTYNYNYDHLVLPVTAKITFGGERFRGFAELGGYASYVVRARKVNRVGGAKSGVYNLNNYQKADAGVILGAGAEYTIGPGALFANLRYDQGLINVSTSSYTNWFTATPSVSVGYILRFGKSGGSSGGGGSDAYSTPELGDYSESGATYTEPVDQRPSEIDEGPAEQTGNNLGIDPQPTREGARSSSDFSEMIRINKFLDVIADHLAPQTERQVSTAEVLSRFAHADVLVIILKNGVQVDYYGIAEFLKYIEVNHFRYKITDRVLDDNGMITEIRMKRIG